MGNIIDTVTKPDGKDAGTTDANPWHSIAQQIGICPWVKHCLIVCLIDNLLQSNNLLLANRSMYMARQAFNEHSDVLIQCRYFPRATRPLFNWLNYLLDSLFLKTPHMSIKIMRYGLQQKENNIVCNFF